MTRGSRVHEEQWGGEWTVKKLNSVEKYLEAYLTAMKKNAVRYGWNLVYIDAFSGAGSQFIKRANVGEVDIEGNVVSNFVQGSTMRALGITKKLEASGTNGFDYFDFIDMDESALSTLKATVKADHSSLFDRCRFYCGDSNCLLPKLLERYDWSKTKGVIFIDPFHANFTSALLQAVAATKSLDVWFLFPLSAIGRMLALNAGKISEEWMRKLDGIFGSHDWYSRLYTERIQESLFDGIESFSTRESGYDDFLIYTKEWLQDIFGSDSVLNPLLLNGPNNSPYFALFAAVSSDRQPAINLWKKIAKYIIEHA